MTDSSLNSHVLAKLIEKRIFFIRNQKVMLDSDLADLYGVETKQLKRAVKRNLNRFPPHFMFELNAEEFESLRYQFGTSKGVGRGGSRYAPYAFTEQGVAMLSSVLRSDRAIQVNIVIMTTFVKLRELVGQNTLLLRKVEALEQKYEGHDKQLQDVFRAIRDLVNPPERERKSIGIKGRR